jgi:class 3 adenylate cyclase/tetratricopeptide (TPR) repeat protein
MCGVPLSTSGDRAQDVRKTVTVLFCDLVGSTAMGDRMDPEVVRALMSAYFDRVREVLERHGGTVEKFIGDAVVAVFGVPIVHEDDALRAVRAGYEIQAALVELGIPARIGVNTGEVLAHSGDLPVTGDPVNVAARLEQHATPGDVLIGDSTYRLVKGAVVADAAEPLVVKGKRSPVRAWRLASVTDAPARPLGTAAFVNRQPECDALIRALDAAVLERRAKVVTVLGPPGIGKSRLVHEFTSSVADRTRVVGGRCLSYGEGTSVFALSGVVRGMVGEDVEAGLAMRLSGVERGGQIAARVAAAVGAGGQGGPAEEIQWAVRRLLECVASDRALVIRLDDVHWAEPWLLDLVEYLAAFATAPVLVVSCARTEELLEVRAELGRPGGPGDVIELEALSRAHTHELVSEMLAGRSAPTGVAEHIASRSDGNPLFAEQVVALEVARDFVGTTALPLTLRGLLQERIDNLKADEREVLARAAVEGVVFHRSVLTALADDELPAKEGAATVALMRKGFITTAVPEIPGEDAFRFHHVLLRDAAYQALPKERRARMHVRVADWMDTLLTHHHELIGHHLREAWRYMGELDADQAVRQKLGLRAASELELAANFAVVRSALPAAARLLGQAAAMLPEHSRGRVNVLVELGDVLLTSGRLQTAEQTLTEAVRVAQAIGDASGAAHASMLKLQVALQVDPDPPLAEIRAASTQAEDTFRRRDDDLGMCRVYHTRALGHWFAGRCEAAGNAWVHAADHARAADRARLSGAGSALPDMLAWIASAAQLGPEPAPAAIDRCLWLLEETRDQPLWQAFVRRPLGHLYAMRGEFARSRAEFAECRHVLDEMSETIHSVARDRESEAALLEGDAIRAERMLRDSMNRLRAMGDRFMLSFSAAVLARAVEAQGRANEGYDLTLAAERLAVEGDILAHVSWRVVRARILAERGDVGEAERIAREAVELAATTDWLVGQADAAWTLASTLFAQNRQTEADRAFEDALNLYERKEAIAMVETARALRVNRYRLTS